MVAGGGFFSHPLLMKLGEDKRFTQHKIARLIFSYIGLIKAFHFWNKKALRSYKHEVLWILIHRSEKSNNNFNGV